MKHDDLVAALVVERFNGKGWRTPGWEPPRPDEVGGRRRLRELGQEVREHEKEEAWRRSGH